MPGASRHPVLLRRDAPTHPGNRTSVASGHLRCGNLTLAFLAILGGMAARTGGAPMMAGMVRVTFWGALGSVGILLHEPAGWRLVIGKNSDSSFIVRDY